MFEPNNNRKSVLQKGEHHHMNSWNEWLLDAKFESYLSLRGKGIVIKKLKVTGI